jgi:hypothetical protein
LVDGTSQEIDTLFEEPEPGAPLDEPPPPPPPHPNKPATSNIRSIALKTFSIYIIFIFSFFLM